METVVVVFHSGGGREFPFPYFLPMLRIWRYWPLFGEAVILEQSSLCRSAALIRPVHSTFFTGVHQFIAEIEDTSSDKL
jgi:hypothetical protein